MNKKIVNKLISALGVMALVGMVYLGVNAFKSADDTKVSHNVEAVAKVEHTNTVFVPQWYQLKSGLDSTSVTVARDPNNYILSSGGEPCSTGNKFCGVKAEPNGSVPNLNTGTDARAAIELYFGTTHEQNELVSAKN
ncbi:hypothetical protein SAMN05216436_103186 [bacterium A37T11]|nr:hypothetical protein SAMN05216436_103186 [bacterium A37T11]